VFVGPVLVGKLTTLLNAQCADLAPRVHALRILNDAVIGCTECLILGFKAVNLARFSKAIRVGGSQRGKFEHCAFIRIAKP
jgi:hypothetical protein